MIDFEHEKLSSEVSEWAWLICVYDASPICHNVGIGSNPIHYEECAIVNDEHNTQYSRLIFHVPTRKKKSTARSDVYYRICREYLRYLYVKNYCCKHVQHWRVWSRMRVYYLRQMKVRRHDLRALISGIMIRNWTFWFALNASSKMTRIREVNRLTSIPRT